MNGRPAVVPSSPSGSPSRQVGLPYLLKRALDVTVAAGLVVATAPLTVATSVAIVATDGLPVFFVQERPGRGGKTFRLVKFRTMRKPRGEADADIKNDGARLTPVGRLVRSLSLDELPQLLNVLRGDMSLVGPRPLLVQYLGRYSPEQARRHDVLPGITGWAQINGRNAVPWSEKFRLDVWYVDHWSLGLDLRILAGTLSRVLRRDGISHAEADGAPTFEFMGNEKPG